MIKKIFSKYNEFFPKVISLVIVKYKGIDLYDHINKYFKFDNKKNKNDLIDRGKYITAPISLDSYETYLENNGFYGRMYVSKFNYDTVCLTNKYDNPQFILNDLTMLNYSIDREKNISKFDIIECSKLKKIYDSLNIRKTLDPYDVFQLALKSKLNFEFEKVFIRIDNDILKIQEFIKQSSNNLLSRGK